MLQAKNDTMAENFQSTLERYKSLAIAMVLDNSIQRYLECDSKQDANYSKAANDAKNVMSSCQNMHLDMNFIAVVSYQMEDYLYRGNNGLVETDFRKPTGRITRRQKKCPEGFHQSRVYQRIL